MEELRRLAKDAVTDANVARAKSSLFGGFKLNRQLNFVHASEIARNHFFNLGSDFDARLEAAAQKLTADDVRAAAAKYFSGDNYVMAVVRGK